MEGFALSESEARVRDEVKYHTDRVMSELALAARCPDRKAAESHLNLSALHLARARDLAGITSA